MKMNLYQVWGTDSDVDEYHMLVAAESQEKAKEKGLSYLEKEVLTMHADHVYEVDGLLVELKIR